MPCRIAVSFQPALPSLTSPPPPLARCRRAPSCWPTRRPRRVRKTTLPRLRRQLRARLGLGLFAARVLVAPSPVLSMSVGSMGSAFRPQSGPLWRRASLAIYPQASWAACVLRAAVAATFRRRQPVSACRAALPRLRVPRSALLAVVIQSSCAACAAPALAGWDLMDFLWLSVVPFLLSIASRACTRCSKLSLMLIALTASGSARARAWRRGRLRRC